MRLVMADEELCWRVRRWAVEGTFRPWRWEATKPFAGALLAIATPGPLGFLVAFCDQDGREVTPLLLLKNAVPLYEAPDVTETDRVSPEAWAQMRKAVLLYNPGLSGCMNLFQSRLYGDG